jgi:hypothetical protein
MMELCARDDELDECRRSLANMQHIVGDMQMDTDKSDNDEVHRQRVHIAQIEGKLKVSV